MKITVENLKKSFGDRCIWSGIDLTFTSDEIVSIAGKSGQGKTTFLRCLNGLETYDDGKVSFDDTLMPAGTTDAKKTDAVVFIPSPSKGIKRCSTSKTAS